MKKQNTVEARRTIHINASREKLWKITAQDFGNVDRWISGVNASESKGEGMNGSACVRVLTMMGKKIKTY